MMKSLFLVVLLIIIKISGLFTTNDLITSPNEFQQGLSTSNSLQYEIIKVRLGASIKLECNYFYNYDTNNNNNILDSTVYKMLWLKENKGVIAINNEVKYNREKYSIESTSTNTLNLIINNVQIDDNGKYICQHFDFPNLKQFLIVILVPPQPPQILFRVNNQSAQPLGENLNMVNLYENDYLQLNCFTKFTGNPSVSYKWYKNDVEVVNNQIKSLSTTNNILYVNNVDSSNHLDKYTCAIMNEALDEPLKTVTLLNVFFKPYINIFFNSTQNLMDSNISSEQITTHKAVENSSEIILCSVKANPKPTKIEWFKNQKLIENITDYSYEISRISINDRGLYSCRVYNSLGFGEYEVELNVQYKPILNIESIYEIREGQNANIVCEIDSNPLYTYVTWYFNKQQLLTPFSDISSELSQVKLSSNLHDVVDTQQSSDFSLTDFSFVQYSNRSVLRINSVKSSYNNAIIQCVVGNEIYLPDLGFNEQLTSEISTQLNVLYKPIVDNSQSKLAVELNGTTELNCTAKSNPFSNFYWVFNDEIIDSSFDSMDNSLIKINNDVIDYDEKVQVSTLTINSVQHKQFGWYKCIVNNSIGVSSHEVYLMLATIPDPPTNLAVVNKTYSSILLIWKSEFDGGSEQIFSILINNNKEIKTKSDMYLITNLEDSTEYQFKIKSMNKYGQSSWSQSLNVTTSSYSYTIKDIKLQIINYEREDDNLKILLSDSLSNKTNDYLPSKLKYSMKLASKASPSFEYVNIANNQTYINIPYTYFVNKSDQVNASICLEFNKTICSSPIYIDLIRFAKQSYILNENGHLGSYLPNELLNVVSKRFNLLVVIAGAVLTALLIMVLGGYLIYRISFGKIDNKNNDSKKKKNGLDVINSSPIIAYSEQDGMHDFQFPTSETLDAYSLNSTTNINNTFNASKIIPIPEVNEEIKEEENQNEQQSNKEINDSHTYEFNNNKIQSNNNNNNNNIGGLNDINKSSTTTTTGIEEETSSENLQDNPIYNHLSNHLAITTNNNNNNNNKKIKNRKFF